MTESFGSDRRKHLAHLIAPKAWTYIGPTKPEDVVIREESLRAADRIIADESTKGRRARIAHRLAMAEDKISRLQAALQDVCQLFTEKDVASKCAGTPYRLYMRWQALSLAVFDSEWRKAVREHGAPTRKD